MSQKKGHTGNPNGRPKGSPNKATSRFREFINDILSDGKEEFKERLKKLEDRDYIKVYIDLMSYTVPKMAPITQDDIIKKEIDALQRLLIESPIEFVYKISERLHELEKEEKQDESEIE